MSNEREGLPPEEGRAASSKRWYFAEGTFAIVVFDEDPQQNPQAPARVWTPQNDDWREVLGDVGIAVSVAWSGDYYPIPEDFVPEMQRRCRERMQRIGRSGL
ncbi:hypothetical protein [Mycolicibacterium vaccae]|uniref:hypothetical protein n=1 Tax=Mycolicibacterium vaccae TaxID=1810 RepID=UPI003CFD2271